MHQSLRQTLCLLIAGSSLLCGFAHAKEPTAPTSLEIQSTSAETTTTASDPATTAAEPTNAAPPEAGEPAGSEPTTSEGTAILKTKTKSNQSND